jgi:hypothetical protein
MMIFFSSEVQNFVLTLPKAVPNHIARVVMTREKSLENLLGETMVRDFFISLSLYERVEPKWVVQCVMLCKGSEILLPFLFVLVLVFVLILVLVGFIFIFVLFLFLVFVAFIVVLHLFGAHGSLGKNVDWKLNRGVQVGVNLEADGNAFGAANVNARVLGPVKVFDTVFAQTRRTNQDANGKVNFSIDFTFHFNAWFSIDPDFAVSSDFGFLRAT